MREVATTSNAPTSVMPEARLLTARKSARRLRLVPLAIGAAAMAVGIWTGLARLGVALPGGTPALADFHGALMISGFLGTLISLERAVALGRAWPYGAPVLSSLGALALLAGVPHLGALAFILASAVLLSASARIAILQPALFTIVLTTGAACWTAGTAYWLLGYATPAVVGWWLAFLVLTIAAERLELGRLASPPRSSQVTFAAAILLLLVGAGRGELAEPSAPFTAVALLACAAWLLRHDIARRTIRIAGQPRFSAISILLGHLWLGVAGLLLLIAPAGSTVFSYDAAVHAITIGFVLSLIFWHPPNIFPAGTALRSGHNNLAYVSLALLHVSVASRIAGDLLERIDLRAASGIVTAFAMIGYAATLLWTALGSRSQASRRAV